VSDARKLGRTHPRQRRGAGGRWHIWAFRAVLWAVILLIGYRGVAAIVSGSSAAGSVTTPPASRPAGGFPAALAEAYALQFGAVYLNFSPATATQRADQLSAFLPPGADSQLGWNGAGSQQLASEQVAGIAVQSSHRAIVTLLAMINGHLMELGVPLYSASGGLVVSGEPALLPPPARVTPPQPQSTSADPTTEAVLTAQLPAFFQAYASGDEVTLGRFLARGAQVTGLGGAVTFGSLAQVSVPAGGTTRHVTATVIWHLASAAGKSSPGGSASSVSAAPAALEMTYEMTVVRQQGTWYVRAIGAATELPGPP
jgi:Conjugative transposon protein TcpC